MISLLRKFYRTWWQPVLGSRHPARSLWKALRFLAQLRRYQRSSTRDEARLADVFLCLDDDVSRTSVQADYFHQAVWALERIQRTAAWHVDVGSEVGFVGMLSVAVPTFFLDLRPPSVKSRRLMPVNGSILALPFRDGSVASLSTLNVIEHIGLGRYGDPLHPEGTREAARELARVLKKGGNLFVSLPVGRPRVCFNAHRILSPAAVMEAFEGLTLHELAMVDASGCLRLDVDLPTLSGYGDALGLFWFTK